MPSNFATAAQTGNLSSRDRRLINAVKLTPEEQQANYETEVTTQNLAALEHAIGSTTDPKIIKILSDERTNLIHLLEERASLSKQELQQHAVKPETNAIQMLLEKIQSLWK